MSPRYWIAAAAVIAAVSTSAPVRADAKNEVRAVSFDEVGGTTRVHVRGARTPTFTVYKLERPARVVIDLPQARLADALRGHESAATFTANTWAVSTIAAQQLDDGAVRVVVTLARPGRYDVKTEGNDVVILVMPRDAAPKAADVTELARVQAESERAKKQAQAAEQARIAAERSSAAAAEAAKQSRAEAEAAKAEAERLRKVANEQAAKAAAAQRAAEQAKQQLASKAASSQSVLRAQQVAQIAKEEAERAKAQAAKASADAEAARRAAQAAQAEAERMKRAAEQARREALAEAAAAREEAAKARTEMARTQAETEKAREEAAKRQLEAMKAREEVARAQAEAQRVREEIARKELEATKAREQMARTQAEAEKVRQEIAKKQAEATKAREEMMRMQAEAERAKAELARAQADAQALVAKSRAEVEAARSEVQLAKADAARARSEAEAARVAAAADKQTAEVDRQKAEAARKSAEQMLAEAKRELAALEQKALATQALEDKARAALAAAQAREEAARETVARAMKEREAAEAAAQRARDATARSAAADHRRHAADAKAAEERLAKARQAAAEADARRLAAEQAAARAKKDLEQAKAALASVEQQRASAVAAATEAARKRSEAEAAASDAVRRRDEAVLAANEAAKKRREAEAAARDAAKRRGLAESARAEAEAQRVLAVEAARAAEAAKQAAEKQREIAETAAARARAAKRDAEASVAALTAKRQAAEHAAEALAARAKAEAKAQAEMAAATARKAGAQEIAAARREVARLAEERKRAEAELAERRKAVAHQQAEAARLEAAAAQARDAADREEARRTQLAAQRIREEQELARITAQRKAQAVQAQVAQRPARSPVQVTPVKNPAPAPATPAKSSVDPAKLAKSSAPAQPAKLAKVDDVTFDGDADSGVVALAVTGDADVQLGRMSSSRVELIVDGAELAPRLERTLDVSKFGSPVKKVSSFRDRRTPNRVRLVAELAAPVLPTVVRDGGTVRWRLAASQPVAQTPMRTQSIKPTVVGGFGATSTPLAQHSVSQVAPPQQQQRGRRIYRGATVELHFKDAPLHDLMRIISDVAGINIVIPENIDPRVTVDLRRVPWDQALDVILESHGLGYRRYGNIYRIAPRKELDAEDEAEAARRAAAAASEMPKPEIVTLNYASADELKPKLEGMLSPKGKIEVDGRMNSLIINDIAANRQQIVALALQLDIQTPQISIEARIVEARSTFVRQFGIQWGGRALMSAAGGNATGLVFPSSIGIRGGNDDNQTRTGGITALPSDFAVNLPAATGSGEGGAIGLSLGSVGGNFNINLRLSALEDTGTVRIISAPKITVLNNKAAMIKQGVSIPISVVSAAGTQTQFVQADLSLEVTPYVSLRDCAIAMQLNVTKNEPDFVNTGARGDPTILRKEARTTMLVKDGETSVLGGIYTRNTGLAYKKVPFFADLPVLGWFFKSRRENDDRTEILVFITPKITNRASLRCGQ